MTDTTLNRFLAWGTAAQRTAFTPSVPTPASGPNQVYEWEESDTGLRWAYVNGGWVQGVSGFGATVSPAAIGSNQNNYSPAGLATAGVLRLTASAPVNITGLLAPTPTNQTLLLAVLGGSSNIVLTNEDASSTAANRFDIGGNTSLPAESSVLLYYDSTTARWRLIGQIPGAGTGTVTSVSADTVYLSVSPNPITTTGTVSATTLTESSVDSAQHQLCGGI
jgi:hypothetical protein